MTKFIFHGGRVGQDSASDPFYKELVKDVPRHGMVLMVYFASRSENNNARIQYDIQKCKEFASVDLRVLVATPKTFMDQLAIADAVFLRGGSTEKLLEALRRYPNLKEKMVGKTIAGSSAGAYALSTYFSSHYEDIAQRGLAIVPVRVVTHYGSEKMPPRPGAVEALKNTAQELELIVLREVEWRVVEL